MFETERLIIREIRGEDKEPLVNMAADGSWIDVGFDKKCREWIEEWIEEARMLTRMDDPRKDYLAYAIVLKETEDVVGLVGCSYYMDLDEVGITYCIGGAYCNQGFATEAVKGYIADALKRYENLKFIATIREENSASWKVAEKCGFELSDVRMYRDVNDEKEELYRFYVFGDDRENVG